MRSPRQIATDLDNYDPINGPIWNVHKIAEEAADSLRHANHAMKIARELIHADLIGSDSPHHREDVISAIDKALGS
jgi:predicted RNase H-related nuclease YkuK (DUF458 family)